MCQLTSRLPGNRIDGSLPTARQAADNQTIIPNGPVLRPRADSFKEAGLTEPQIRYAWHDAAVPAGREWGLPAGTPAPDGYQD